LIHAQRYQVYMYTQSEIRAENAIAYIIEADIYMIPTLNKTQPDL